MKNKVYEKFEKELQAHPDNRSLMVISDKLLSMCDNEAVCKKLANRNDIFYGTNKEVLLEK